MNTKALRQKVLDLAIHGKLVPQNPNDESATVLLEKIRAEKAEKIKRGELKADKKDSFIFVGSDKRHYEQFADGTIKDIEDEIPFDLPKNWAWCRLKEIISINPRNKLDENLEVSFIPMTYIDADYKNTHKQEKRVWKEIKTGFTHFAENDVAIAKISPCFENRKSVILHNLINGYGAGTTELFILRTTSVITSEYLLWIVKTDDFINAGVGNFSGIVGQQRLAKDVVENYLIPLPPFEEQQRIVSSINDAFSQINLIENNSTDLQTAIKQAKAKILDLAIHGKLVPQDPTDEPAEELLKRIATSDNRPYEKVELSEIDWTLPNNWCLCHFGDIATVINGKNQSKVENQNGKYPIYGSGGKMGRADDYICPENCTIIGRKGSINNPIFVEEKFWNVDTAFGLCPSKAILPKFLFYFCEYFDFTTLDSSTTLPSLTKTNIQQIIFALPPIEEQKRILDKTNELFDKLNEIILNLV